ncbi:MAG: hypothetical protein KGR23_09140, partial [Betaproteobacteria bacterium]|nr:hypothetical protein [Betaproteobacteria bacterium]
MGNLKQYQFGVGGTPSNPTLFLADANGNAAISGAGTGFLSPTAVSFWNPAIDTSKLPDSIGGFWVNNPQGAGGGYDNPDGEIVEKGGVGQQIRLANLLDNYTSNPTGPRNVYTCTPTAVADAACSTGALSLTPFATSNGALTATALGITNATYTANINSISRNSSTGKVTVTLSATPSPAIADPTLVTISGSASGQYDYALAGTSPTTSGTTITYTLPAEYPPIPPSASYKVTGPAAGKSNITSLTRNSDVGWFLGTAVLSDPTFSGGSNVAVGDVITIANSIGGYYDGSNATVVSVSGGNTVTFRKAETPNPLGGGGTISNTNGSASIGASTGTPPGVVRGTSCSGCTTNSGKVLMVTIPGGTKQLNPKTAALANGTTVSLTGVTPANYVLSGLTVIGTGAACSVTYVNSSGTSTTVTGTANSGSKQNTLITSICVDLGSTFSVFPSVSGDSAQSSPQTYATRQNPGTTLNITGWSITSPSTCPATGGETETVQATTSSPHGFSSGGGYVISGTSVPANESVLTGSKTITVTGTNTFTYSVATTPTCTDSTSGMKITYQAASGAIDPATLINWVRGDDNRGDELSPGNGITIRPSVHGDVLHSRPAVVNYGGLSGVNGVVVFYGANDGTFRAINGNQPGGAAIGGASPGGEIWSFVAPEFYPQLSRLYLNSPSILLATTPSGITPAPQPKSYFFDGSTGVYQDSSHVYIFLSARRGGRFIEALDVTDPANPLFLWKRSNVDLPELGYTWSQPKPAKVRGYSNPVLIFGGGYDPNEDNEPPATDTMGRGIFILDATNGNLVWSATYGSGTKDNCTGTPCTLSDMAYAIPADVTLVNRDFDQAGYIDRLYAADLGGNIWRVDLEPAGYNAAASAVGPSTWQITKFAALGGSGSTPRKFFYPPDIVATKLFDMILAGTGDREHPLYSSNTTQAYS